MKPQPIRRARSGTERRGGIAGTHERRYRRGTATDSEFERRPSTRSVSEYAAGRGRRSLRRRRIADNTAAATDGGKPGLVNPFSAAAGAPNPHSRARPIKPSSLCRRDRRRRRAHGTATIERPPTAASDRDRRRTRRTGRHRRLAQHAIDSATRQLRRSPTSASLPADNDRLPSR